MALTVTTLQSHVGAPLDVVLMRQLLAAARRTLPYINGAMPGELERQGGSMTVKWRRIENLAANTTALGEVATAAFQMGRTPVTPTITDLTVAVQKYGNFMNVGEEVDIANINSTSLELMDTLGENAGHSINLLQRDVYNALTTNRHAGGVANTSSIVTALALNDVKYSNNQLQRNSGLKFFPMNTGGTKIGSSPIRASYFGICHSDVEEDIRGHTGFVGVEQYGGYTQTFEGEFGFVGGVRWASTEVAPVASGAGVTSANGLRGAGTSQNDIYSSFVYGRMAVGSVGLGEQYASEIYMGGELPSPVQLITEGPGGVADPFREVKTIAWKAWWAGKVLNTNWIQKIESAASDLS